MKKIILSSVLATAAVASLNTVNAATTAQVFCSGTAGAGAAATVSTDQFVRVQFTAKCSSNTYVQGSDSTTFYRVGAVSSKGKSMFAGSTSGGGVMPATSSGAAVSCQTPTACTDSDAGSAITYGVTG
ncbi:MAG TPA: hypothetical protein VJ001_09595 [Rhodocyclaceae bacterium]|nr:hypothetical protein [Rhodocyclaceae bacterium]